VTKQTKSHLYGAVFFGVVTFLALLSRYVLTHAGARIENDSVLFHLRFAAIGGACSFLLAFSALQFGGKQKDGDIIVSPYFAWVVIGGFAWFFVGLVYAFTHRLSSPWLWALAASCLWGVFVIGYRKVRSHSLVETTQSGRGSGRRHSRPLRREEDKN
jgi:hypothetical protein